MPVQGDGELRIAAFHFAQLFRGQTQELHLSHGLHRRRAEFGSIQSHLTQELPGHFRQPYPVQRLYLWNDYTGDFRALPPGVTLRASQHPEFAAPPR